MTRPRFARPWFVLLAMAASASASASASALEIHRYAEPGPGSVNSWVIEGADGVVMIDTQRSVPAGRAAARLVRSLDKPLVAVLVSHPHPDHFGGLAEVLEAFPGTPVYASARTGEIMRTDSNGYIAQTKEVLGEDAPAIQPLPDRVLDDGEVIEFGDIRVQSVEAGAGEASTTSIYYLPDDNLLFAADVVDNRRTGFLVDGRSAEWLDQIRRIRARYAELDPAVYPGHGDAGTMALFDEQEKWLETLRAAVAARRDGGVEEAEIDAVVVEMEARYPDHPPASLVPDLMRENVRAVVKEMDEP